MFNIKTVLITEYENNSIDRLLKIKLRNQSSKKTVSKIQIVCKKIGGYCGE